MSAGEVVQRLTMDEFNRIVNEALETRIKAMGLDKIDLKHGVVPSREEMAKLPKHERAIGLVRALFDKDLTRAAAMSEGIGPEGGYLVPEEFRADVIRELITLPVIRARATVFPVRTAAGSTPRLNGAVKMFWEGESQTFTPTTVGVGQDVSFGQILWRAWRLDGFMTSSRELFEDAGISVYNLLVTLFAEAMRAAEEKAFVGGSGVGQPQGFRNAGVTNTAGQAGANLAYEDIITLYYKLPRQYRPSAVWLLPDAIVKLVRLLKDSANRPIWTDPGDAAPGLGSAPYARLLGKPVIEQDDIPVNLGGGSNESEIWFADLRWYYIFDREIMAVETSTEAAGAFEKHQQVLKVYTRMDGEVALPQAFAYLSAVK